MTRLVIDLGDIQMTRETEAQLADQAQQLALSYVAKADIKGPLAVQFPIDWIGIIVRPDFERLEKDVARVGEALGRF